ncbi:DUF955 domain-containing protein [Leisingera caerulea]|uniref:DUF955 domain-containing protein n=1 Tax=Leisingera caerulea TaxID=506591 RepID=A0ABY5WT40_LEICA|nr:DUF955 domain-containing protein [Leisingera caerulea]UWQ57293.1 DUF955 domain-containing protein [Leisingera caerulea]
MVKNVIIKAKTALDIDRRIERVLKDLGNPEPPLDLEVVRELLELDLAYYTANDPGVLQEVVSKLTMAGKQVIARPSRILDAVRKWDLRALYIPDRKKILLDKDQPLLKHRWHEAHEVGHSLLPWHAGAMLGDNEHTLIPSCHEKLEAEANFAAGRLLFLRDRFAEECLAQDPSFDALKELKKTYGNTYTTTFWRGVETWGKELPILGLITDHPHVFQRGADFDPKYPCKHFIQSSAFAAKFSTTRETDVFDQVVSYCRGNKAGPLGEADVVLTDDNGDDHVFHFESFSFHHQTLTLGVYQAPYKRLVAVA